MTTEEFTTDSPRNGATGFVLFAATLALVGAMLWQANAPAEHAAAGRTQPELMHGPVTGREFAGYINSRVAENPELADRSKAALELAEMAGDEPIVTTMAEFFANRELPSDR